MVLGKKYFSESESSEKSSTSTSVKLEEFQEIVDELFLLNGVLNIGDWIPWLGFLDLQGYEKRMKALKKRLDRFRAHVLDEHMAKRKAMKDFEAKDMVDLLLELVDNPDLEVKLTYDNVKGFIQDLIAAGTDSSASTVEWAMSELLKQPNLMDKATEELDRVIGKTRWVSEKDIAQLPFLEAVIKETLRKHPVAVLLAPHLAIEDCNVNGYYIRKGTPVFVNAWSIARDPSVWDAPEEFRPERFLGKDKDFDIKGQRFEMLPFGSGRRMCPGYSLGMKMVSSTLANLLHGFSWKLGGSYQRNEDLDMDEAYGLATIRKFPLVAVMEPRLPVHLYDAF
ncbi:Flavonoid 3',5'-hydroxylase [Morus notabilis]|uniref:Flavonoid 3',5'-hydroxylase n=1 Tax=Morus notabilis TaxID=981085 RepID=W9QK13_9ROSA|nr:Flavonoid 3',5'-hydroxylase [Morus notabilis]